MHSDNVNYRDGKQGLVSIEKKGSSMDRCATFNKKYLCCGVRVLNSVQNCPYECSYCFLQNYLTDGTTKAVSDINKIMTEVIEKVTSEPDRMFRIGTWELGDSLALEGKTGQAANLIRQFAGIDNAVLELKTKSNCVDDILNLDHKGKTVISWSMNTEDIVRNEEHGTASLSERINAARKAADAGYLVGIHFDPMVYHNNWERGYEKLVRMIFSTIPADRMAWISMGSLRFNPEMKKKIENNYPDSRLTCAEMVLGDDSKMRYVKPLRINMYRHIYKYIAEYISDDNLIYLCMERWDMWDRVFGHHPHSADQLDYLFAESLYKRFGLGPGMPDLKNYDPLTEG